MRFKKNIIILFIIVSIILNNGCSNEIKSTSTLNVFIASSLTESMEEIKELFQSNYPDVKIQYNIASSSRLATQIIEGAECDIFISANVEQMNRVYNKGLISLKQSILSNKMIVIISNSSKGKIKDLGDLVSDCKIVIAHKDVPAGRYALQVLENLNNKYGKDYKQEALKRVVSEENNVRQVVTKIILGEGDVGIVYTTDLMKNLEEQVGYITIPIEFNVSSEYWICKLNDKETTNIFYEEFFQKNFQNIFHKYNFKVR